MKIIHGKSKPAINELNKLKIPLILNSSKTICEIEMIRKDLNIFYPVVAENGAVIEYQMILTIKIQIAKTKYKNFRIIKQRRNS